MSKLVEQLKSNADSLEKQLQELKEAGEISRFALLARDYNRNIKKLAQFEEAEKYLRRSEKYLHYAFTHLQHDNNTWSVASISDDLASIYRDLLSWGDWNREATLAEFKKIESLYRSAAEKFLQLGNYVAYAGVHINISGVYVELAQMHSGQEAIDYLHLADEACHTSIEYRNQDGHAHDYAVLQDNHGGVHLDLAWLENFEENIQLAIEATLESSAIFEQRGEMHDYGITEGHLALIYSEYASKQAGHKRIAKLQEAERHYRNALEHIDRDADLTQYAYFTVNLANVVSKLGNENEDRSKKLRYLKESIALHEIAIRHMKEDTHPEGRFTAINNMALDYYHLAKVENPPHNLRQAELNFLKVINSTQEQLHFIAYKFLALTYSDLGHRALKRSTYIKLLEMSRDADEQDNIKNITKYLIDSENWMERIQRWLGLSRY